MAPFKSIISFKWAFFKLIDLKRRVVGQALIEEKITRTFIYIGTRFQMKGSYLHSEAGKNQTFPKLDSPCNECNVPIVHTNFLSDPCITFIICRDFLACTVSSLLYYFFHTTPSNFLQSWPGDYGLFQQ